MNNVHLPQEVISTLPTPLVQAFQALKKETDSKQAYLRQVYRLIDLIESLCKLYTVASVCSFLDLLEQNFEENQNNQNHIDAVRISLAAGLRTPSLGIWWRFAKDSSLALKHLGKNHILPEGIEMLIDDRSPLRMAFENEDNLISFRNRYAHGATPAEEICAVDFDKYWEVVKLLMIKSEPLGQADIIVVDSNNKTFIAHGDELVSIELNEPLKNGHIYFRFADKFVNLFPLLTFHEEKDLFYFYNDLKENYANFLNYPYALHFRDKEMKSRVLERIPISKWSQSKSKIAERIELLTEVFKGRNEEISSLSNFVKNSKTGFFVVWGSPGVGKSALLARFSQLMNCSAELRREYEQGSSLPDGKVYMVEYFIRRGDSSTNRASEMFRSLCLQLNSIFELKDQRKGKTDDEWKGIFEGILQRVSTVLKAKDEKLVLLIDGLDEADPETPLISYLPRFLPPNILVIYGSRPILSLKTEFFESLDRENKQSLTLTGLKNMEDIRAILMEYVNKYELESGYINGILDVSEGNPLYIKLLCNGLVKTEYKLNDISKLPESMETMYLNSMKNLGDKFPDAVNFLILLSAARDFITPRMAARILDLGEIVFQNKILLNCLEFLYENPLTPTIEDYQLFHDSLREFLKLKYPESYNLMHKKLSDFCFNWKKESGDLNYDDEHSIAYSMAYAIPHLYMEWKKLDSSKSNERETRKQQILTLTDDPEWRELNFRTLGNGEALRNAFTRSQEILIEASKGSITPQLMNRMFNYAFKIHEEPLKQYSKQIALLKAQNLSNIPPEEHLRRIFQIAKIGDSPVQKMMLVFLGVWSMVFRSSITPDLEEIAKSWLESSNDKAIYKLWQLTFE